MKISKELFKSIIIIVLMLFVLSFIPTFMQIKKINQATDMVANGHLKNILDNENSTRAIKEDALNMYNKLLQNQSMEYMNFKLIIMIMGIILGLLSVVAGIFLLKPNKTIAISFIIVGIVTICYYVVMYILAF